jgi:hypothetical protein
MVEKRLLTYFVKWLSYEGPDRSEIVSMLRSPHLEEMLQDLKRVAIADTLLGTNSEWERLNLRRFLMIFMAMPDFRECACGCGKWFLAERRNQRHCGDHRKLAWQRGMTAEQRERRRVQNQQAQRRYYDRDLKAKPRA